MKLSFAILCISLFLVLGCKEETELQVNSENDLFGKWSYLDTQNSLIIYKRVENLNENRNCFAFEKNFSLVERKIDGWCATPPVLYSNYNGTWKRKGSELYISVAFYGGTVDYEWKIISLDNQYLTVYKVKEDYHWENRN